MSDIEPIDIFSAMVEGDYHKPKREIERRARAEGSSVLTQNRKRKAVRTSQIAFRCSPEFKKTVDRAAKARNLSIADVMDLAFAALHAQSGGK